jgi:hypothetical protein
MEEEESFGDAFARNRAAGADTFTYKGNLYTTDLAPSTPAPSAPTVSYDAFGNEYSTPQAAAEADQTMAQQSATANQIVGGTEESLFEQPVVSESAQEYLDSLGTDFDFGQFDTPGIDYTVSQGEAGRGGPDSAAPTFSYEPGVDPAKEILVNLKNTAPETLTAGEYLQATQYEKERAEAAPEPGVSVVSPITASDVSATATNPRLGYESGQDVLQSSADYLTGLDGSGPNTTGQVTDAFYGGTGAPVSAAVAMQDAAELAEMAEEKTLGESILDALAANSQLDKLLGTNVMAPYAANIPVGVVQGIGALTSGLGQTIDQLSGTNQTNLALERMRDVGPMSNAQEEFMIRQAAEEGLRMRDTALKPRDETFYQFGSKPFDYAQEVMKPYYEETIPRYEGRENIYKNLETYEDVVGFEPGQIDRQLLDAVQAKQSPLETAVFGQGPGSAVRMDGSGFDPSTAAQKSIEGAGSTAPLLGLSLLGPGGTAAAILGGQQSVTGELSQETDAALQGLYETGRQDARDLSQMPSAVLGGGATAVEAALLRMGLPGAAAIPIVEGLQEGPGESIAANQILQTVTGFGLPVNRRESIESGTAGIGGGATVAVPVSGAQAFVPTSRTAGQPAQSNVPSSYTDNLMDTGMGGVGDVASDASSMEVMAAEKIIEDQVASTGTVDPKVAENLKDRTGLSSEEINNMAEKAGGTGPFILTPEMRVQEGAFQLTPEMRVQEPPLQLTEDMRVDVPAAETPVDLSGVPSRLTLTGAESLGPTTPDLSGIASNLNLGLPQTPAIPADPATPSSPLATIDTTLSVGDTVNGLSVSDTLGASTDPSAAQLSLEVRGQDNRPFYDLNSGSRAPIDEAEYGKPGFRIVDNGDGTMSVQVGARIEDPTTGVGRDNYTSASMILPDTATQEQQRAAINEVANTWKQNYEGITSSDQITQGEAKVQPMNVDAITTKMDADAAATQAEETTETPVFTSVRTPDADAEAVFTSVRGGIPAAADAAITSKMDADAAATQREDVAAVIDLPEEFQEQLELPLESDQTKTLAEDQTKTLEEDQTKTLEEDQTKTLEEDQTSTIVSVPVITQTTSTGEDDEVEVEVDDDTTTTTTTTDDDDGVDIFVPPVTTTDDDGNTITECPEGYEMVETADGPMCQKITTAQRQRAGRGVQAYTGIVTRPGERGPGQRRITTTRTERVRPTTRSV